VDILINIDLHIICEIVHLTDRDIISIWLCGYEYFSF